MSLSISSASTSYADLTALRSSGGGAQAGGEGATGTSATAAASGAAGAASAQGAQSSVGGPSIQSNSVSQTASGGSATPPPPAASGRGQLLDIAA
jgi:hypothetical protein